MQLVNIRLVCFKARVRAQEAMVDAECGPGAAMLLMSAIGEENEKKKRRIHLTMCVFLKRSAERGGTRSSSRSPGPRTLGADF